MIDIKRISTDFDLIKQSTLNQKVDIDFDTLIDLDKQRKSTIFELDEAKKKRNDNSSLIAKGKLDADEKNRLIQETRSLGDVIKKGDQALKAIEDQINAIILTVPNILHEKTPIGDSEDDNIEVDKWGSPREFDFTPSHHADLSEALDILDTPRGVKLAHSRFTLVKDGAAKLERALMNFMLDVHTSEHGYREILPPFLVNADCLVGTGQLPKFEEDLFKTTEGLYLIPTSEVPLTNIHKDEILKEDDLPLYYTAYTPCFRSEAGSYGKDTKGYIRQHQFNKVEMVKFTHPDKSYEELDILVQNATEILKRLELPYRIIELCSGDIGFSAAKCFDIEVWVPSEQKYREISSCSNCTDFQARRANIRYKPKEGGKNQFVHTLNGSGLAIGRTLVAILENYQTSEGSVLIPDALKPYMGGLTKIEART